MTDMETPTAWDDENGYIIVYGTHDPIIAQETHIEYLRECGFKPGDEEWTPETSNIAFYEGMSKLWTYPKAEEQPFDLFKESRTSAHPYMVRLS